MFRETVPYTPPGGLPKTYEFVRLGYLGVGPAASPTSEYLVNYDYDGNSDRLKQVAGTGLPSGGANYSYLAGSHLLEKIEFKQGSTVKAAVTRSYEPDRDLLAAVENKWGSDVVSRYTYAEPNAGTPYFSDELGRRTQCVREGAAFAGSHHDVWSYNARNELTGSTRRAGTAPGSGTVDADLGRGYEYDPIGNREWYDEGQATRLFYCTNELNQYETTAAGDADCPPNTPVESFTHDLDGNLTQDGRFTYAWDAENRLISATPVDPNDPNTPVAVTFAYDYMSRRVRKQILEWSGGQWVQLIAPGSDVRFLWYNWLMLLELDDSNAALRKYAWGLDLAGQSGQVNSLESAGGIGGLLAVYDPNDPNDPNDPFGSFVFFYDGNGNVGQVVDPNAANVSAAMVARYEYDAYGNVTAQAGSYAATNPFRFSTKYWDDETGLGYWGLRYYDPGTGRWLSRDPLEESGDITLLRFTANNPANKRDAVGLQLDDECLIYSAMDHPPSSGQFDRGAAIKRCAGAQKDTVLRAVNRACECIDRAHRIASSPNLWQAATDWSIDHSQPTYPLNLAELYKKEELDEARQRFAVVLKKMKDRCDATWGIPLQCECKCSNAQRWAHTPLYSFLRTRQIYICPLFFTDQELNSEGRAGLIAHELSHLVAGTDDNSIGNILFWKNAYRLQDAVMDLCNIPDAAITTRAAPTPGNSDMPESNQPAGS